VPVYDFGEENGQLYLVMRYMPGGSLADRLRQGPLPLEKTIQVVTRIASALDAVHEHGIVHRDLKPGNILFDQYDNAFLSDFGIVRLTQSATTLTGDAIIGTPSYMSPEQVRGESDLDGRSDIYALGAILFEMLTGRQPYEATTPMGVALKHITEPVPRILDARADLPPETQFIIQKAMAKDRNERFARAGEVADTLEAILARRPLSIAQEVAKGKEQRIASSPQPLPSDYRKTIVAEPELPPRSTGGVSPERVQASPRPQAKPKVFPSAWIAALGATILVVGICALLSVFAFNRTWFAALLPQRDTPTAFAESSVTVPKSPAPSLAVKPTLITHFSDDFSNPESGWRRVKDNRGEADYVAGSYRISVEKAFTMYWATPHLLFKDVSIAVEANKVAGVDESAFGILCRVQPSGEFYALLIRGDGGFNILKFKNEKAFDLDGEGWNFSEDIHQGKTANLLRADCIRDTLTLYVNGMNVTQAVDGDFSGGDVGLIVLTEDVPGTSILFDRFSARQP
jgi:serine/threonine-protein kinase